MTATRFRITVPVHKPRNPFAAALRHRHAGAHGLGGGARRQQMRQALRRELRELHPPSL
jgi:hypothetical protein